MQKLRERATHKNLGLFLFLSLLILIFFWQYLSSGNNKTTGGDFDYYSQMYEAFRITVLKFHQFPLWNPWLAGGLPLMANPQFGFISLQAILVLPFGAIYGLKLAYVGYALAGYWGMYAVGRRVIGAPRLRSALVSYIWIFSGFFAGHGIWHFTFTSFFLLPWLIYFIAKRRNKFSWLWLGIVGSVVILSSIHYAFLMMSLVALFFFALTVSRLQLTKDSFKLTFTITRKDLFFVLKAGVTVLILAGYQFVTSYMFVSHNQRIVASTQELANRPGLLFKALFFPFGSLIQTYPRTAFGWGEYSMYAGLGTGLAILVCVFTASYYFLKHRKKELLLNQSFIICLLLVGLLASLLALGNFSKYSPFHILHALPGFAQTRVPSRWQVFTVFSMLAFLLAWRRNTRLINILLFISVIELFRIYGPTRLSNSWFTLPPSNFSNTFTQYDNGMKHLAVNNDQDVKNSYYYSTSQNVGQIYADDAIIDTLDKVLGTNKCGINIHDSCNFILTGNARVDYWSPNKIKLTRTSTGPIELNMNMDAGWRVNDKYVFAQQKSLNPAIPFRISDDGTTTYILQYSPNLSPSWFIWKVHNFL